VQSDLDSLVVMEDEPMAKPLLTDELWELIEPCLPPPRPRPKGGRKPIDRRRTLTGILFVLKTGIPWEDLPQEMGCGCGMTCWRRLHEWQEAGVWQDVHHVLLNRLREADKIDWSRAVVDSASVRAVFGGRKPAPTLRIAGKTARSTTSSPMRTVFRSPRSLPVRTGTT
jgi:transposase